LDRRRKQAGFRDAHRTLDNFDVAFNPKMNRSLIFDLATAAFIGRSFRSTFAIRSQFRPVPQQLLPLALSGVV
jgi:hypothetical protein